MGSFRESNQANYREWDSRPRGGGRGGRGHDRGSTGSNRDPGLDERGDRGRVGRGHFRHHVRGRSRHGSGDSHNQGRFRAERDPQHGHNDEGADWRRGPSSTLPEATGHHHRHRPSNVSHDNRSPSPSTDQAHEHQFTLAVNPQAPPPPPPQALPPSLDLSPADQLKLATVQGLMQPYVPFWVQTLPAAHDDAMAPLPHFIHTCCSSLTKWLQGSSPQVMTRWLVDVWMGLHPADARTSTSASKDKVKITIFDAVWTMWATTEFSETGNRVESAGVVAGALAAFASLTKGAGTASFDPSCKMPFAALIQLVDFQSTSSFHTLISDPILRILPAMDMRALTSDANNDAYPPPSKRPRAHHHRDRHHSSSRANPPIPPPIPPYFSSTLDLAVPPTRLANLTRLFSHILTYCPPLDSLRDSLLLQTSDPRLKLALLDTFIAHCATPTMPAGLTTLDLSTTYLLDLFTHRSTLGGITRSLLRHLPMAHIASKPALLAILHAYFAQPTTDVSPHALFADLNLPAQTMLDLMLALASSSSTSTSSPPSSSPLWMHHVLISVLDSLVGAVDLAAVPLTAWDVFCHVLDTPVLARMMLKQLRERNGPVVAAVHRVVAGYDPAADAVECKTAKGETAAAAGSGGGDTCAHGHAPEPWSVSADHVPLMLREWTWRWTKGRTLVDAGVIEDLARVDFSGMPALAEMQRKVVATQVARYVEAGAADALVQRLVHVLMTVEHAPREAAKVVAVVLRAVAKEPELLEHVVARGLYSAFSERVDAGEQGSDKELTPEECAGVLERMVPLLLHMPMCGHRMEHACPVVHGLVSMLFGSNKTFGLVLHRVFHYASPDVAHAFLTWLAQLAARVPPSMAGVAVGISSETVAGAILYTANADVRKASGMARVLEQIGKCMLSAASLAAESMNAVIAIRAELYDYLLFEFFKEFTRLADKRVALEAVHSLWNGNARSSDGHVRGGVHGDDEVVGEKEMISLGIDTLALPPAVLDPSSSRRLPSQGDWTRATEAAALALTHLHQRLDHLAVGFTVLYRAWDLQQIDLMLSSAGSHPHPSGRVPLLSHIVNVLTMTGTHPETGTSWSFPSPYLLQVLARIGSGASSAFVTILGHQLVDQLGHCDHVPNSIVNAAYKAVYAVLISALQQGEDPAAPVPFALLVKVFASVLMVEKELWPLWQRAVACVPEMKREHVTRDMYQMLVQQVLGPVEQRAAVDLWWCTVEGVVRRKVPMPV